MCRPRPFPRAHKREASGGLSGTNYSPKVSMKGCKKGPELIDIYSPKRNRVSVYWHKLSLIRSPSILTQEVVATAVKIELA